MVRVINTFLHIIHSFTILIYHIHISQWNNKLTIICVNFLSHFPQITKGHTYVHVPNQRVNLLLTSTLIIVVAMVAGLGIGHFLGKELARKISLNTLLRRNRMG